MQGFSTNDALKMTEARVIVDGEEKTNTVTANAVFTINTAEVPILGARTVGDKPLSYKITGTMSEYKVTRWLIDYCKKFQNDGVVEPFDIQGVIDDRSSMYDRENGVTRDTLVNCVLTGDIPIFSIDATGELVTDKISFTAEKLI